MIQPARSASGRRANTLPREVRLIGGVWKRSRLPVADSPGLRPTPDRVRETLFNWLGQDLRGWSCLDAFAGSGALGFECGSRGAAEVVLLESDARIVRGLEAVRERLSAQSLRIERADAIAWMRACRSPRFDLILLDPPFASNLLAPALVEAARLLVPGGFVYVESEAEPAKLPERLELYRASRAGAVYFGLLRAASPESKLSNPQGASA